MSSNATRFLMLLTTTTPTPSPLRYPSLLRLTRRHRHHILSCLSSLSYHHHHNLFSHSLPYPLKINSSPSHYKHQLHTSAHFSDSPSTSTSFPSTSGLSYLWPEWSNFVNNLSAAGYFNIKHGSDTPIDEPTSVDDLPEEFLRSCAASLAFARDKPQALGMLSRRDVEVVVQNGLPFLFRNSDNSVRRMKLFLHGSDSNVPNTDKASTLDLMKFLLSYASTLVSSKNNLHNVELVESSVRSLFTELAQLGYNAVEANLSGSFQNQFPDGYGQTPRPRGKNIEMKRGDWICARCNFMNFARNVKCLECDEQRPKGQLTGGEWECPQCDFYNYARNMVCLRCDCKRPGSFSPVTTSSRSDMGSGNGSSEDNRDLISRLAANEKKAQQRYSNVSQMDSSLERNGASADEDFPEIMPLRKGVNRFVVSTRKAPLERRLADSQYQENMGTDGTQESNDIQRTGTTFPLNQTINQNPASPQFSAPRGSTSNYVPFVPLAADMFANKPENSRMEEREKVETHNYDSLTSSNGEQKGVISEHNDYGKSRDSWQPSDVSMGQTLNDDNEKELDEKSDRWFKRVAELHNVTDLTSAISDEEFPEIMPLRKGENKFVVSKKKDRSLTSPMYKRRMALEQANTTNSIPFVPFPPNYFAKKDNQESDNVDSHDKGFGETLSSATLGKPRDKLDDARLGVANAAPEGSTGSWSGENLSDLKKGATYGEPASGKSTQNFIDLQPASRDGWNTGNYRNVNATGTSNLMGNSVQNFNNPQSNSNYNESSGSSLKESISEKTSLMGTASQSSNNQDVGDSWTGKSLEGSAVKEPDPLDMSEEAKAERWFRRVAQIKDISELSQIPDEDFPSIMPMRKGVNRFVVSKRKTPLERRLTSTKYRRNLPIVSSDPVQENDSS